MTNEVNTSVLVVFIIIVFGSSLQNHISSSTLFTYQSDVHTFAIHRWHHKLLEAVVDSMSCEH